MKLFGRNFEGFAGALVFCATALLIASGLCGVQYAISSGMRDDSLVSGLFMITGVLELIVMVLSTAAIVGILFIWPITAIFASSIHERFTPPPKDRVQRLFDDKQDGDNNKA
jgi:hypothetical protein